MDEDVSITDWVSRIRARHPDLPNRLTSEVEHSRLETLKEWRERVQGLREAYEDLPGEVIPDVFDELDGGRIVIPTRMSIETMTDEEVQAWHELFACVAPQMAQIAHKYWRAHDGEESSLVLADVLDYLPVVFLYVLSNYDENRRGDNDGEFAEEEGRTRLTTWIAIESRRHIKSYLQSHAYLIGPGSSYLHRLRSQMRKVENDYYTEHGSEPSREELVSRVREQSYYGRSVSKESLAGRLEELKSGTSVVSTDASVDGGEDDDIQYKDVMSSDPETTGEEMDRRADIHEYIRHRADNEKQESACLKILTSNEPLTVQERLHF